MERRQLSDEEIASRLLELKGWAVREGMLEKTYSFGSYLAGPAFAAAVAHVAEALDHHPDILIQWRKVTLRVNTHDVGGITGLDFALAHKVEALLTGERPRG